MWGYFFFEIVQRFGVFWFCSVSFEKHFYFQILHCLFHKSLINLCLLYADDSLDRLQKIKLILQYYSFFLCYCASTNCLSLHNYFLISISSPLINIYFRKKKHFLHVMMLVVIIRFSQIADSSFTEQTQLNTLTYLHQTHFISMRICLQ